MTASWTIDGVQEALAAKKISARELAADFYKRIESRNPELNAFLTLSPERARRQTDRIDALVAGGKPLPPLAGVPVAVKDVISTRGIKTTCGSKILQNYVRHTMRPRLNGWRRLARSFWEKPTATNSQWEARTRTRPTGR